MIRRGVPSSLPGEIAEGVTANVIVFDHHMVIIIYCISCLYSDLLVLENSIGLLRVLDSYPIQRYYKG